MTTDTKSSKMLEGAIRQPENTFLAKGDAEHEHSLLSGQEKDKAYAYGQLGPLMHKRIPLCLKHEQALRHDLTKLKRYLLNKKAKHERLGD